MCYRRHEAKVDTVRVSTIVGVSGNCGDAGAKLNYCTRRSEVVRDVNDVPHQADPSRDPKVDQTGT